MDTYEYRKTATLESQSDLCSVREGNSPNICL